MTWSQQVWMTVQRCAFSMAILIAALATLTRPWSQVWILFYLQISTGFPFQSCRLQLHELPVYRLHFDSSQLDLRAPPKQLHVAVAVEWLRLWPIFGWVFYPRHATDQDIQVSNGSAAVQDIPWKGSPTLAVNCGDMPQPWGHGWNHWPHPFLQGKPTMGDGKPSTSPKLCTLPERNLAETGC